MRLSLTERALMLVSRGAIVSTAAICPGFTFVGFGNGGPHLSPDQHWVLVDILGPYAPGNVPRTAALVYVRSGAVVRSPDFPSTLGIPNATAGVSWVSGERATLRYANGKTAGVHDPPFRPLPVERCSSLKSGT